MEQNLPRRLARLYRNQNAPERQESYSFNESEEQHTEHIHNRQEQIKYQEEPKGLPTMDYNDVNLDADKKNLEELKKIQQKNLVEKLALEEVERFKIRNNRMPNSKEEEQIAENLFKQLKNEPSAESNNPQNISRRSSRRRERGNENEGLGGQAEESIKETPIMTPAQNESTSEVTNVKDLFGENEDTKQGKKETDEFDISLGDLNESDSIVSKETEEISDIEEVDSEDKKTCPNCKKQTNKIIYCSKCGTAFCDNCAKIQGSDKLCPKCQTKTKL